MMLEDNESTYTLEVCVLIHKELFLLSYLFLDGNTQWGLDTHNHVRFNRRMKTHLKLLDSVFCSKYLTELRVCHYCIYYVVLPFNLLALYLFHSKQGYH